MPAKKSSKAKAKPVEAPKPVTPPAEAYPIVTDPLLAPEAQQPGESAEDYQKRVPQPQ